MTKLEAAGNDFVVVLDPAPQAWAWLTPASVRRLCHRRLGIGADGLIVGRSTGPEQVEGGLRMFLFNADGSEAEMSGNGVRCLVHAAIDAGLVAEGLVQVGTAAGPRSVDYRPDGAGAGWARVGMGPVRLGDEVTSPLPGARARLADVGNPHLVVVGDIELDSVDLGSLAAPAYEVAGGAVNLEVVRPGRTGADLELRVLERGAGETLACGTGTCAAAAVARGFGMVGDTVAVDNPGGRLEVRLGPEGAELGGPVRKVAVVVVDAAFFGGLDAASGTDG